MWPDNFAGIKWFNPGSNDQWGDPSKIDKYLLLKLDQLRELVNTPIHVTSGYRPGGNTEGSQHAYGRAVDVIAPGINLNQFYEAAERIGFSGLGVYPHWRYSGRVTGGLHLDVRPGKDARWMGVLNERRVQVYIGLNEENLKQYGVKA